VCVCVCVYVCVNQRLAKPTSRINTPIKTARKTNHSYRNPHQNSKDKHPNMQWKNKTFILPFNSSSTYKQPSRPKNGQPYLSLPTVRNTETHLSISHTHTLTHNTLHLFPLSRNRRTIHPPIHRRLRPFRIRRRIHTLHPLRLGNHRRAIVNILAKNMGWLLSAFKILPRTPV